MKVTWPYNNQPMGVVASVDTSVPGEVLVQLTRNSLVPPSPWRQLVVADADGQVRFAMLDPRQNPVGCEWGTSPSNAALRHGKLVGFIRGESPNVPVHDDYPETIWGVRLGQLRPKVLGSWAHSEGHVPVATDQYWGSWNAYRIEMATWGGPLEQVFHGSQAGGLQQVRLQPWHDFALWGSSTLVYAGIMAWKAGVGAYPFITYPGDWSRGVHNMGTDGIDLVWTYSEGKGPGEAPYPSRSVMTAPFTTDPASLEPRRLRSHPCSTVMVNEWAVGCGHAGLNLDWMNVLIVRQADSMSWMLTAPCGVGGWCWGEVYALTCEEVFLRGTMGKMNITRVRLDSLGPGMAPD